MASQASKLEGYIISELSKEFDITNQQTLQKLAAALSKAVHTYITTDVEVRTGIQSVGQDPQGGSVNSTTVTTGKTF